ncbi:uncharacterized protein DEA37_0011682 [Paragonimus westermani]|uniref:EF-hand domain-containing protein n=1 Tax=Paragonimus westermani TaxID=34504 RepID=A0A5J4NSK5_9TREM|nr:uncharacterized protein DEA37_0011682 [Paragonimus westermani]
MAASKKSNTTQRKKNSHISEIKLDLTNEQKGDLLRAFNLLDVEGNGLVRIREVKVALRAIGFEPTASELRRLMTAYDKDNKGLLDYSSFLDIMTKKMTEKDTKDDLMKAFKIFDCEDSGYITFTSLKKAAELLGEDITDEELQEHFGNVWSPRQFKNLDAVGAEVLRFEVQWGSSYRIRSTEPASGDHKRRVYTCVRRAQALRSSTGVRERASAQTGCSAYFKVNRNVNSEFRVTKFVMLHNNPCDVVSAKYEVSRRRFTEEEIREIRPWLLNGTVSFNITQYIWEHFDKKTTKKDLCNLRARLLAKRNTVGHLVRLHAQLSTTAIAMFLRQFLLFVGPVETWTMIIGDSAAIQGAITQEMLHVHQLLCRVHILRNVRKTTSNGTVKKWFLVAMLTRNRWRYAAALAIMQATDPAFYNQYLMTRLIRRSEK